jgi:hypothetical protein
VSSTTADVELPILVALASLDDGDVVRPAYFSHRRCEFLFGPVGSQKFFIRQGLAAENPFDPGNSSRRNLLSIDQAQRVELGGADPLPKSPEELFVFLWRSQEIPQRCPSILIEPSFPTEITHSDTHKDNP